MAKELKVSKFNRGFGWKRPALPLRSLVFYPPHFAGPIPDSVDLRPQMPAVYDQGSLGACVSHALAGLSEFLMIKNDKTPYVPSRLFIYYNARAIEDTINSDSGASLTDGATVISKNGCPNETNWWYDITKFTEKPSEQVYVEGLKHLVKGVAKVSQNLYAMQQILASGYPIAGGFTVYSSFEDDSVTKTGIVPMPLHNEQVLGGHAVLIVGYDIAKRWFIVRNSWGLAWGDKGYCYMPFDYWTDPNLSDDFWSGTDIG